MRALLRPTGVVAAGVVLLLAGGRLWRAGLPDAVQRPTVAGVVFPDPGAGVTVAGAVAMLCGTVLLVRGLVAVARALRSRTRGSARSSTPH